MCGTKRRRFYRTNAGRFRQPASPVALQGSKRALGIPIVRLLIPESLGDPFRLHVNMGEILAIQRVDPEAAIVSGQGFKAAWPADVGPPTNFQHTVNCGSLRGKGNEKGGKT